MKRLEPEDSPRKKNLRISPQAICKGGRMENPAALMRNDSQQRLMFCPLRKR
jgi:hypothetical protein